MALAHDAIVLAGGTGRRMGGARKPQVTVRGRRLLDHVLDATAAARRVVVVAPQDVPVPDGVTRTLENPPHGGPVAGIAAGLAALGSSADPAPESGVAEAPDPVMVLVLACDLPGAAAAVPRLLAAVKNCALGGGGRGSVAGAGGAGVATGAAGVVMRDGAGREQWLLGVYSVAALRERVAALEAAGRLRGTPVRELVHPWCLMSLAARPGEAEDVDTWADRDAIGP